MLIRPATAQDIEALARFAAHAFSDNFAYLYEPEELAKHLEKTCSAEFFCRAMEAGDAILLAMEGENIAGYAKAGALGLPVENSPVNCAELHRLYVDKPYQHAGVGKQLMEAALALPVLAGASHIYLGVWENNFRAQNFYRRYGFEAVGEYLYYVGKHADRELIMVREQ